MNGKSSVNADTEGASGDLGKIKTKLSGKRIHLSIPPGRQINRKCRTGNSAYHYF